MELMSAPPTVSDDPRSGSESAPLAMISVLPLRCGRDRRDRHGGPLDRLRPWPRMVSCSRSVRRAGRAGRSRRPTGRRSCSRRQPGAAGEAEEQGRSRDQVITAPLLTESSPPAALAFEPTRVTSAEVPRPRSCCRRRAGGNRPEREDTALIAEQGVHEVKRALPLRLSRLAAVRVLDRGRAARRPRCSRRCAAETSITFWPMLSRLWWSR